MNLKKLLDVLQDTYWQWHLEDKTNNTYQALADGIGKSYKTTWNYFNPNEDGDAPITIPPISMVGEICNFTGNYELSRFVCNDCNGFFTLHPHVDPQDELSAFKQVENHYKTSVRLSETFLAAIADGKITSKELNKITQMATAHQAVSQEMIEWSQAKAEMGKRE